MNWWQYLLLVNLYLVLFYGFYALLLRRETFFQLNRVYLVSASLLSFFIPLIQAGWVQNLFITQRVEYTIYSNPVIIRHLQPVENVPVNLGELFACLYLAGVAFLAVRLIRQFISLNRILKQPGQNAAYSFFKKIKLNEQAGDNHIINAHEQIHAKQWHSADVLIIEAVMIINWFNPVVYFYRRAVKHIHEFIADSHAIKTAASKADYALLLLTQTFNPPQHQLVNHFFNNSLLKQRIMMLQKDRSQRIKLVKYGLSAPLFMLMLILSSATVYNSKAVTIINSTAGQVFATPAMQEIRIDPPALVAHDSSAVNTDDNTTIKNQNITLDSITKKDSVKDPVFASVEQNPEFIGGPEKFSEFLAANIKYPASLRDNNTGGKAIVTFIIEKDGSVSNAKALSAPNDDAATEAIRVVNLTSGKWMPGLQNHQYVRVQYTVPVEFSMQGKIEGLTLTSTQPDTGIKRVKFISLNGLSTGNDPMCIVDGKEIKPENLKLLDPNQIESISILKDKTATLQYGNAAVNGVIIITMKKK